MNDWTENEKLLVAKFRKLMKPDMPEDLWNDQFLFYKFLKARDFNLNHAETMLRKHLRWRKEIQIDTIVEDFKPIEVHIKYISQNFLGFNKDGNLIFYSAIGNCDGKGIFKSSNKKDVLRLVLKQMEVDKMRLKQHSEKLGRPVNQCIYIYNMEHITLSKVTHRSSLETFKNGIAIFQDNFPEFLKTIYIINGSVYFTMAFAIVKNILSGAVIDKIKVYGKEDWKEELLKVVGPELLPAFLGGNRTDPDGNPNCNTFINHGGIIPKSYYLTKDISKIASKPGTQHAIVEVNSSLTVPIIVSAENSVLHWEFELKSHDIGFGLSMAAGEDTELSKTDLIPIGRVETELVSETGKYRCKCVGTYIITFDNSYSWFHSKEIYYRIWLES